MRDAALFLEIVGFWVYATPFFLLAALSIPKIRLERLCPFMSLGPLIGLSLGGCILGALSGIWMDHETFSWDHSSNSEMGLHITFFMMWVSNIKFEIWTLDPIRKAEGPPPDAALRTVNRHLWLHCTLLAGVLGLSYLT